MKLQIKTIKSFQKQQESHLNETHQFQFSLSDFLNNSLIFNLPAAGKMYDVSYHALQFICYHKSFYTAVFFRHLDDDFYASSWHR